MLVLILLIVKTSSLSCLRYIIVVAVPSNSIAIATLTIKNTEMANVVPLIEHYWLKHS